GTRSRQWVSLLLLCELRLQLVVRQHRSRPASIAPIQRLVWAGVRTVHWQTEIQEPFCRPEINLSHGAEWKALINTYITVIPLTGDEPCIAMQSMSGRLEKKTVHRARPVAAWPRPAQTSTLRRPTGEIDTSVMAVPLTRAPCSTSRPRSQSSPALPPWRGRCAPPMPYCGPPARRVPSARGQASDTSPSSPRPHGRRSNRCGRHRP